MTLQEQDLQLLRAIRRLAGGRASNRVSWSALQESHPLPRNESDRSLDTLIAERLVRLLRGGDLELTFKGEQSPKDSVGIERSLEETEQTFRDLRESARQLYEPRAIQLQKDLISALRNGKAGDRNKREWDTRSLERAIELYEDAGVAMMSIIEESWRRATRAVEIDASPSLARMVHSDMKKIAEEVQIRIWSALGTAKVPKGALDGYRLRIADENIERELHRIIHRFGSPPPSEDAPSSSRTGGAPQRNEPQISSEIFIVHGHDELLKERVARFLLQGGANITILAEKANRGQSLIEKFERHASQSNFAVILLTPDDTCRTEHGEVKRARQNVIFELGFFVGSLGRERVCALYTSDVELPSDYPIAYIDSTSDWRHELTRELRAAGIPFFPQ